LEQKHDITLNEEAKVPLEGTFKVSFILSVVQDDNILVSDIAQAIGEGFGEGKLLAKVSELKVDKIEKVATTLRAGDRVCLQNDIEITSAILCDADGNHFIGEQADAENLGEQVVILKSGSQAIVNKVVGDKVELIELDISVTASFEDDTDSSLLYDVPVSVDLITLSADLVEKVADDEVEMSDEIEEEPGLIDPEYKYIIDLNERGYFNAHVEDPSGKVIFEMNNEELDDEGKVSYGGLWLVDAGYMRGYNDVAGLESYLKQMEVIPQSAVLREGY
jgi:hypothetical protein